MVRCFLVHTVCSISSVGAVDSRVIYSRAFGPDESITSVQNREFGPEERRLLQREKLAVLARQVRSAVSLSREASGKLVAEMVPGEEAAALQEADSGVLRLRAGDPFCDELSVLWLGIGSLAFTVVCEAHDNLILAETTLRVVTRYCLENLHMLGPGSEVLLKSDRLDVLLSRLLPHGQLLFLNHRFAQSLEKDIMLYMAK